MMVYTRSAGNTLPTCRETKRFMYSVIAAKFSAAVKVHGKKNVIVDAMDSEKHLPLLHSEFTSWNLERHTCGSSNEISDSKVPFLDTLDNARILTLSFWSSCTLQYFRDDVESSDV
eukprot:scpid84920/ scgid26170/ 